MRIEKDKVYCSWFDSKCLNAGKEAEQLKKTRWKGGHPVDGRSEDNLLPSGLKTSVAPAGWLSRSGDGWVSRVPSSSI